jgi:hypothetical protein
MTDEQINAAIAEACGWKGNVLDRDMQGNLWPSHAPRYCADLNAMHEAEKTLFPYYASVYSNKLAKTTNAEYSDDTDYFCATARQRAEAFLLTLGKWSATDKDSLTVGAASTEQSSVDQNTNNTKEAMTDEQINDKIGEVLNLRSEDKVWIWGINGIDYTSWECPNFYCSLDSMHQAERALDYEQAEYFELILSEICARDNHLLEYALPAKFAVAHSTARQRAEAFLRALGLWREALNG